MISIVIPTWQRPQLLMERALPSILGQGVRLEVIVVSDGPAPADTVSRILALDSRIRYLEIPRPGYPSDPRARWYAQGVRAINHGIDRAAGDRILVMGDDDELADDALSALLAAPAADVVYGASSVRQRDGQWMTWLPPLGDLSAFPSGAALIDRERLSDLRLDPDAWRRGVPADRDFWERLQALGFTFAQIATTVFRYWPSTAYEISA